MATLYNTDNILAMMSHEDLMAFCKKYAASHSAFVEALRKYAMPNTPAKPVSFDECKKEVDACYRHAMKSPRWYRGRNSFEPDFLDWENVGEDLKRVIKRLSLLADKYPKVVVETAVYILKANALQYEEDYLGEREDWDCDDMHCDECMELISQCFEKKSLTKEYKLQTVDELERVSRMDLYTDCDCCDFTSIIEMTRESLLTEDEQLGVLIRNFKNEESSWRRSSMACEVWTMMMSLGKTAEADIFFKDNDNCSQLRNLYIDQLLKEEHYTEAINVADRGIEIANKEHYWGNAHDFRKRELNIYEAMNDTDNIIDICSKLFTESRGKERIGYYRKLKETVKADAWPAFLEKLLDKCDFGQNAVSDLTEIYSQEGQYLRLFQTVEKADFDHTHALEKYGKFFTPEQHKTIAGIVEHDLTRGLSYSPTRKTYQELAAKIKCLANTCSAGLDSARRCKAFYLEKYPNRPALRDELSKIMM